MELYNIEEPVKAKTAVGIDLGTSNSLVAYFDGSTMHMIESNDSKLIPSVVAGDLVGRDALLKPNAISSFKRDIANDIIAQEASSRVLKFLIEMASDYLEEDVSHAVITVPAYFNHKQRTAVKNAAENAGIEVIRLINEPTAAALAYGITRQDDGVYAAYDLGGGTFDITILRIEDLSFQILSTVGDLAIGGDDIDIAIQQHYKCTLEQARQLKQGDDLLKNCIDPIIEKTLDLVDQAVQSANVDIDGLLFVGGPTKDPYIRDRVINHTSSKALACDIDPQEIVAWGAAYQAYNLTQRSSAMLLDVTPFSLSMELMNDAKECFIEKNTSIPHAVTKKFTNGAGGQVGFVFNILQGESQRASLCEKIGSFELDTRSNRSRGEVDVFVTFQIDANGIVIVTANDGEASNEIILSPFSK